MNPLEEILYSGTTLNTREMVSESKEADVDVDAVEVGQAEVGFKPESDDDDEDEEVIPFAARNGEGDSEESKLFLSFCGTGEPDGGQVNGKHLESELSAEGWPLLVAPALRSLTVPAVDKDRNSINEVVERDRECVGR